MKTASPQQQENLEADPGWHIGLVCSSFYKEEVKKMVESARACFKEAGLPSANVKVHWVAGSFEIPLIGSLIAEKKRADALIGFGIIVEGETQHARLLAEETARGMMSVQLQYGIPFAFEVLYVLSLDQARKRAQKGEEAARSVLLSLAKQKELGS